MKTKTEDLLHASWRFVLAAVPPIENPQLYDFAKKDGDNRRYLRLFDDSSRIDQMQEKNVALFDMAQ